MGAFDILNQIKDMGSVNDDVSSLREAMGQRISDLQSKQKSAYDEAAPWLAAMAGFAKPTKTGSFFEALGPVGESVGAALQKQSEKEQAAQDKLMQLQQARANLGLDMIQKQANLAKVLHDLQTSQAEGKMPQTKEVVMPDGTRMTLQWNPESRQWTPFSGVEGYTPKAKPPEVKSVTTPSGGTQSVIWDEDKKQYIPVPGSENLPGKPETPKEPVIKEFTLEDGSKVTKEWNPESKQWISPSGVTQPAAKDTSIKPVDPAKLKELGLPPTGPDTEQFLSGITDPKDRAKALQEDQKASQKVVGDFNAAAKAADTKNEATKRFMQVAEENKGRQGPLAGMTSRFTTEGQQLQKFANESTMVGLKDAFGSRVTNLDLQFGERANVSPQNSYETNKQIATARDAVTERIKDQASFYRNWYATHRTTRGADDAWAQYMSDNPIFDPKGNPNNPASIKKNDAAVNWKTYFRGMHEPATDDEGWSTVGGTRIKKVQ